MSYDVIVKIIADGSKAKAEFDKAGRAAERMAKKTTDEIEKSRISMEKYGRQAGVAGAAMLGAAGTIAYAMKGWVASAQEAEKAQMRLESSVRGAYGVSSNAVKAFEAQAKAIQKVTVASDEDVMSIQAMLVQFGLTKRQVETLTPLVVDIARKWGIDYVTAAKAVSKAADGKATALKRLGINVDEAKAKTDPYIATVEALRKAAGGFAQQEGKTFAGQTAILSNQMDELKESLGRGVLTVLNKMLPAVNDAAGAFTNLDDKTGGLIGSTAAISTGFLALSGGALLAFSAITKLRTAYAEAAAASEAFALAQTGIGAAATVALGAVIGASLGTAINEQLYHSAEKAGDAYKKALSAEDGRAIARDFFNAAGAEASSGGNVISGVLRGLVKDYKAVVFGQGSLNNIWGEIARGGADKAFQKIAEASPQAARGLLEFAEAHPEARRQMEALGADFVEYKRRLKDVYDINKDGKHSAEEFVQYTEDQAKAVENLIGITSSYGPTLRGFAQATLGVANAQKSLTDAQIAYNEAVKSGDPAKVADAQLQLQSALLGLADAQDSAREAAFKHGEMLIALQDTANDPTQYSEAIAKLERMKALLTDPAEKQAIQDKINMLTWFRAMAQAPIDTKNIVGPLGAINAQLELIKANMKDSVWTKFGSVQQTVVKAVLKGLDGRASGGPVAAGTPYIVGEQGPEVFVPSGNGMIVPNSSMGSGTAATVASGGINVYVSSSVLSTPAETGAAVVDALSAWSRRNGRLPASLVA